MTITTSSSKTVGQGNGVTTVFTYSFLIPASGQELVIYTDASGNQTTLTNTQYGISGFGNATGGTVTYPLLGSPIASGTTLTIARILPLVQNTSISNQGAFYPNAVEAALDYLTMEVQQISQGQSQAVIAPIVDAVQLRPIPAAAQRANQVLGFDGTGQPIAAQPSSALVSTVMQPVVSAATIATAVGFLGIPVFVGVGTTTGTANAQVLATTVPNTFTMAAGNRLTAMPGFTNNGPMTLQVGGLIAANVMKRTPTGPAALAGNEIIANQLASFISDGTNLILDQAATLTSPTIVTPTLTVNDTALTIRNNSDITKIAKFQLSGISTATTRTITLPDANFTPAGLDVADQTVTGGTIVTPFSLGTISSGTVTPDPGNRPLQYYTNNGAHTLAPSANNGSCLLDITNGASAGAITTSGWSKVVGDLFTTTNGNKFRCSCSISNAGSLLSVQAMQ